MEENGVKINSIQKGKHLKQKIAGSRYILLVGILLLSAGLGTALAGGSSDGGSVIVTVERQVLGEGFFLEPKAVDFNAGDGGREIVEAALGSDGIELSDTGITAIVGADTGSVAIPEAVQVLTTATLPSADNPELAKGAILGNGAYASAGHWNLTLNEKT
ncbi:hypothetical protein [Eubacterium aggregans]|uniref:hypothetical protein n=1 Tax=Eubacterium aggregans TaxID=81409 RepID=UPI003F3AC112